MSLKVDEWLSRLRPKSQETGRIHLNHFLRYLKEHGESFKDCTPDQLIDYQKTCPNEHRYDILDHLEKSVLAMRTRKSSKIGYYSYVRSFFLNNRAELPLDRPFYSKIHGDYENVIGVLSLEELREVLIKSSQRYRAMYIAMFQGGLGCNELIIWSNTGLAKLQDSIQKKESLIRIDLSGRKLKRNERPYYSFLGGDALEEVKKYLEERVDQECSVPTEAIFLTEHGFPICYPTLFQYWRRKLAQLKIVPRKLAPNTGRTGRNLHELRDLFRTQWAKSDAKPENAEYHLGHTIDRDGYNKSWRDEEYYRVEYLKALPYLNVLSSGKPYKLIPESEIETLRDNLKTVQIKHDLELRALETAKNEEILTIQENIQQLEEAVKTLMKMMKG